MNPAETAFTAHTIGLGVLPPREDGSKAPLAECLTAGTPPTWRQYQHSRATPAHIAGWYANGRTGVGIVTGRISGRWSDTGENIDALEVFEFDDGPTYRAFLTAAEAVNLRPLTARIRAGYEEETPGGGIHWLYYSSAVEGNQKLAQRPKLPEEMKNPDDTVKTVIETRGEGGYAIIAPSNGRVHPTGGAYTLLSGSLATIATITAEERRQLFDLARTFNEVAEKPAQQHREPPILSAAGGRPGDDFAARTSWPEILEPHGWRHVFGKLWRRPGKDSGWSASVDYEGSDLLYVFSTSTPFEEKRGYGRFAVYAILNHAGDFVAAGKALAAQGYGEQHRNGSTPPAGPSGDTSADERYVRQTCGTLGFPVP